MAKYGPPIMDWSVLSNLGNTFIDSYDKAQKQGALAKLGEQIKAGDYSGASASAFAAGDASTGVGLLGLQQKAAERQKEDEWFKGQSLGGIASPLPSSPSGQSLSNLGQGAAPRVAVAESEDDVQRLEGSVGSPGQRIASRLVQNGLSPNAAAGIVSNLGAESSFNTRARNPGDGRDGSDSIGLAQWNGPRAQALMSFAQESGKDWRDPDVQADFIARELRTTEAGAGKAIASASTPQDAARAAIGYFRPAGYTPGNPMGAHNAQVRVAGADRYAAPVQMAEAAPAADSPAPGATNAQGFVIPGTGEVIDQQTLASNPRIQNMVRSLATAPTERARAYVKQQLDLEIADAKTRMAQSSPTDIQRNYNVAKNQGYQGSLLDYQKELRAQTNVTLSSEKAQDQVVGKAYGEQFVETQKAARTAGDSLNRIRTMEKLIENPNFYSGAGAGLVTQLKQIGVKLGGDPAAASANEMFSSLSNKLVLDDLGGSLGTAISNGDRDFISGTAATLANTPAGNKEILFLAKKMAERKVEVSRLARQYAGKNGGRLDAGFDEQMQSWAEANPLLSEKDLARISGAASGEAAPPPPPRRGDMLDGFRFKGGDPSNPTNWHKVN